MDSRQLAAEALSEKIFRTERRLSSRFGEGFIAIDDVVKCFGEMFIPEDGLHFAFFNAPESLDAEPEDSFLVLPSPTFLCHHLFESRGDIFDLQNLDSDDDRLLRITGGRPGWVMLRKSNLTRQNRRDGLRKPAGEEFASTSTVIWAALLYRLVRGRDLFDEKVYAVHPSALVSTENGKISLRSVFKISDDTPAVSEVLVNP